VSVKVQIYTVQTPAEALALVDAGVDHLGITPFSGQGLPGEVDIVTARAIIEAIGGSATRIALTVTDDLAAITAMVQAVRPDVLHLCGVAGSLSPQAVASLKKRIPGVAVMQAIAVAGTEAIQEAVAYQSVADYIILDTQAPDIPGIGASGTTHDWSISRAIVQQLSIPVILAGGLSPENVAEAIGAVAPWGVDSLSHTNLQLPAGRFCKDLERVRQFVAKARAAAA